MLEQDTCQSEAMTLKKTQQLTEFDKCPLEEKIKRLHLIVKELRHSLQYAYQLNAQLSDKVCALEYHQHSSNGECLVRIGDRNKQFPGAGISGASMSHDLLS